MGLGTHNGDVILYVHVLNVIAIRGGSKSNRGKRFIEKKINNLIQHSKKCQIHLLSQIKKITPAHSQLLYIHVGFSCQIEKGNHFQ